MPETNMRTYPRATPYRQPSEQPRAAPRRRLFPLAAGALGLVAGTALGTMLLLNLTAVPAPSDPPAAETRQAATRKPEHKSPAQPVKAAPLSKSARDRYLAALGMMSAAHVYQTYLNIGLLADGVENKVYTKAEAEEMLTTLSGLVNQMDRQLDKVADTNLDPEDKQNIERIQELTVLLRRQASALRAYWATGEREQIDRYHQARETTWKNVSEVLGIE